MTPKELPPSVAWPERWRNVPLWAMFDRVKDVGHPDEEMLSVYREHGVIRKSSRDDNTNQTAENRDIYQFIGDGWFIVNRMKAWQGSVGVSSLRGIVSGHYLCFRPRHDADPRFLNWLLRSDVYSTEYARMSRGVRPGQIEIDNDELRGLRVALPPLDEQLRIADFLDAEAAHIHSLVRLRDSQLEILDELALSTIEDALERLPDTVTVRLGYVARVQTGITVDGNRQHDGDLVTLPYLRVANVQAGRVDLDDITEITVSRSATATSRLRPGDVLMTEGGDLDKLGRGTVWRGEIEDCLHQNHVFAVRPDPDVLNPEYLALLTRAPMARNYFESTGNKTTNLASTSSSKIRDFRIPLTDSVTQRAVVKGIHERLRSVSQFGEQLTRQLNLLAERRQALITAAVTGQIDVTTARGVAT